MTVLIAKIHKMLLRMKFLIVNMTLGLGSKWKLLKKDIEDCRLVTTLKVQPIFDTKAVAKDFEEPFHGGVVTFRSLLRLTEGQGRWSKSVIKVTVSLTRATTMRYFV
jgi:hypothetical protein